MMSSIPKHCHIHLLILLDPWLRVVDPQVLRPCADQVQVECTTESAVFVSAPVEDLVVLGESTII